MSRTYQLDVSQLFLTDLPPVHMFDDPECGVVGWRLPTGEVVYPTVALVVGDEPSKQVSQVTYGPLLQAELYEVPDES